MAVGDFLCDLGCGYWVAMAQFKIGYRRKGDVGYFPPNTPPAGD
jgi:hypothetical protein